MNTDELEDVAYVAERRVLKIQAKLHRWAAEDPLRRFDDLFNLVCDPAFLLAGWMRVRSNKGARTAGVDGVTAHYVEDVRGLEGFLSELRAELKARTFRPLPVRQRGIPKAGGKVRYLGINTIRDRVVQASLKLVLEPIFEADFLPCSYGFEVPPLCGRAARETDWNWRGICFLTVLGALSVLIFGGALALLGAVLVAAAVVFILFWRGSQAGSNLVLCLVAGRLRISWLVQRIKVGVWAAQWGEVLQNNGTGPVVAQLVRHMLGDDPDSLFIPDHFEWGLRAPREPLFVVENGARRQLERKLSHIADGTIAVCGPRGAGKTTLLEQSVKKAGFCLIIQAPATYTPHDFLLSLSVQLCEKYLRDEGYGVPEFTRLSPTCKLLRRAKVQAKRLGRWSSFAAPAAALLVLGLSASVRSLYTQYVTSIADFARTHAERIRDDAMQLRESVSPNSPATTASNSGRPPVPTNPRLHGRPQRSRWWSSSRGWSGATEIGPDTRPPRRRGRGRADRRTDPGGLRRRRGAAHIRLSGYRSRTV
ncbi:hypothetical protein [Streptomyces sp. NBC_00842]|uniref:hypothetical protein n=1 Tax=Streptomyces sp. NBC_00842 TaxID=2975848 RepID=UPI003863E7E9|nr:hypothetical protein OH821_04605 [Streptomyces sp. NBC_00842]